ncbi:MAG: cell envelope integrity EipB family protein [Hoeflea sp.]|uniref:cell envelope integrity EipB family protein n=1 Tax=Hoeflea sp. TaxID=1940281 RepID=UPI001D4B8DA7|nr:cell envelope integrity EipB family protein [Hoeflea sp.]MBU4529657.1 cell envelope integrity EipB family protein [Alphaproteobacteria bacterium]MBU4546776.1 cell envelope integrity EipB family protein [Alphaproteobacteria bacterium]MBU4551044.1 cell envelope integrity EipB family protein [Alphaproteobacteria bacterium]MBV1723986.1 cell envelope integrity EipB family protein [Hoeflea sp.]MBV1763263.1 cell envelope integrity EipB family protein [Hoeflea sp.]
MRMLVIASLAVAAVAPIASPALAGAGTVGRAGGEGLAAHRAVYDLSLKDASERSGITGMVGRMVYEFGGSACEGYTVSFRFVTEISTGDDSRVTDQQTTTFEDIRNQTFRFVTRSFVNQKLDHEIRGSAEAAGNGLAVKIEQPEELALDIAPAHFPTEHMIEMIDKARGGERFYESRIYDGSDEGDQAMITTTILGEKETVEGGDTEAERAGDLADHAYWPVSMSYFEEEAEGDGLPVYSIAFKLYENGVTRDLTMDYGDFVLEGRLAQLDMYEAEPCPE